MSMRRSVLVTGGANGLGETIVRRFHGEGYAVAIGDIDANKAKRVAGSLDPAGETTIAVELDVRARSGFEAAYDAMFETFGCVDVLVNNAALTQVVPVFDITAEQFDAVVSVNLKGTFLGCQVFGKRMRDAKSGRIVNLASLAAQNGGAATGAHYAASKGAIITLTKVFARELAGSGVTVNAIAPGPLDLESVRDILGPDRLEAVVGTIPVGALGSPEFIAQMALLLADPAASSVTGATWDANGGLYVR